MWETLVKSKENKKYEEKPRVIEGRSLQRLLEGSQGYKRSRENLDRIRADRSGFRCLQLGPGRPSKDVLQGDKRR